MRKEESKFAPSGVFEGMVSIRAIISSRDEGKSDRAIQKILYDKERAKARRGEIGYLRAISDHHGFEVIESSADEIDSLTTGSSHGGIIAICSERTFSPPEICENGFYVMLDGVEDPYNFGYALRSLYAAGVDGVVMPPRNWMTAAGVVCRASAGASERMALSVCDGIEAAEMFRSKGYKIIGAEKDDSVSAYESDLCRPLFLIVGGEKRGISHALLDKCDGRVCLDYGRDFPEALSAASAASILAFEVFRQNR
ncbi:MAG: RNA methyltransferase [Clostridia bacterium]|nr:RNA methyltransferase [Clostridia bacterium]